jgi:hypothetical protein
VVDCRNRRLRHVGDMDDGPHAATLADQRNVGLRIISVSSPPGAFDVPGP